MAEERPRYAVIECPNDRTHRAKTDSPLMDEILGGSHLLAQVPQCAECGAQMEIRHYRTMDDLSAGRAI